MIDLLKYMKISMCPLLREEEREEDRCEEAFVELFSFLFSLFFFFLFFFFLSPIIFLLRLSYLTLCMCRVARVALCD